MIDIEQMERGLRHSPQRLEALLASIRADLAEERRRLNGWQANPSRVAELEEDERKVMAIYGLEVMKQNARNAI